MIADDLLCPIHFTCSRMCLRLRCIYTLPERQIHLFSPTKKKRLSRTPIVQIRITLIVPFFIELVNQPVFIVRSVSSSPGIGRGREGTVTSPPGDEPST
jgi:hypothetical protein